LPLNFESDGVSIFFVLDCLSPYHIPLKYFGAFHFAFELRNTFKLPDGKRLFKVWSYHLLRLGVGYIKSNLLFVVFLVTMIWSIKVQKRHHFCPQPHFKYTIWVPKELRDSSISCGPCLMKRRSLVRMPHPPSFT
jgi:hypothetical protein